MLQFLIYLLPENETEVSFFNGEAYQKYKLNPEVGFLLPAQLTLLNSAH